MPQDASVLFIMLDATRADRLSAWGNPHPTTPTLDGSGHPWFVAASDLGRQFDRLELVEGEATRGHADARDVVDRAAAVWRARDRSRPVFLYVHFMDMHMPRYLPDGEPRFPVAGYDWRRRFKPNGEPRFHRERRRWLRADAR